MEILEALRTGLAVNAILIVFAALISAAHQFAAADRSNIKEAVLADLRTNGLNAGFAIYVASGSAFFGSVPFSKVELRDHVVFALVWILVFVSLMTIELAKARISDGTAEGWTLSRGIAVPTGLLFAYWVWSGAGGLG